VYAKRAGVEGTIAQAVRTCEMRRARYIGSKKLRLQALLTATAMNVLRAEVFTLLPKSPKAGLQREFSPLPELEVSSLFLSLQGGGQGMMTIT
jgi:hypothetical protein